MNRYEKYYSWVADIFSLEKTVLQQLNSTSSEEKNSVKVLFPKEMILQIVPTEKSLKEKQFSTSFKWPLLVN